MLDEYLNPIQTRLIAEIQSLQSELTQFPQQSISVAKNGKYVNFYENNGKNSRYLSKKEKQLIGALVLKKYKQLQYEEKEAELALLNNIIKNHAIKKHTSLDMLKSESPYFKILQTEFQKSLGEFETWGNAEYEHSVNHTENLIHQTLAGHPVRSKSEVIIANALFLESIPYRYECALHLGETTFYPDFTILHPGTKQIWYYEHFGMMDKASYREAVYNKLKYYGNYGIIPSINLITTYETQMHPIDSTEIDYLIKKHFGDSKR